MVTGIRCTSPETETEIDNQYLMKEAQAMVDATGVDTKVKHVKRFTGTNEFGGVTPGVVKIELESLAEKIQILKSKSQLRENEPFKKMFIRSSFTHQEMVMMQNTRLLLSLIPGGENYFVANSGKIIEKFDRDNDPFQNLHTSMSAGFRGRGGGRGRGMRGGRGFPRGRGGYESFSQLSGDRSYSQAAKGRPPSDDSSTLNETQKKLKPSQSPQGTQADAQVDDKGESGENKDA